MALRPILVMLGGLSAGCSHVVVAPAVSGVAVDSSGQPIRSSRLEVARPHRTSIEKVEVRTDEQGRFSLEARRVRPADGRVSFEGGPILVSDLRQWGVTSEVGFVDRAPEGGWMPTRIQAPLVVVRVSEQHRRHVERRLRRLPALPDSAPTDIVRLADRLARTRALSGWFERGHAFPAGDHRALGRGVRALLYRFPLVECGGRQQDPRCLAWLQAVTLP